VVKPETVARNKTEREKGGEEPLKRKRNGVAIGGRTKGTNKMANPANPTWTGKESIGEKGNKCN